MYVNSIRIERISGCCEYRFKKGSKLGTGTLKFLSVSGAAPCFRCNVRKGLIKVSLIDSSLRGCRFLGTETEPI